MRDIYPDKPVETGTSLIIRGTSQVPGVEVHVVKYSSGNYGYHVYRGDERIHTSGGGIYSDTGGAVKHALEVVLTKLDIALTA